MKDQAAKTAAAKGYDAIDAFFADWKARATEYYLGKLEEMGKLKAKRVALMNRYGLHVTRPGQEIPAEYTAAKDALETFKKACTAAEYDLLEKLSYADKFAANDSAADFLGRVLG